MPARKSPRTRRAKAEAAKKEEAAETVEEVPTETPKAKTSSKSTTRKVTVKTSKKTPAKAASKEKKEENTKEEILEERKTLSGSKRSRDATTSEPDQSGNVSVSDAQGDDDHVQRKKPKLLATVDEESSKPVVRSLPASRRWWKPVQTEKFSMTKYKAQKSRSTTWEKKMELRRQRKQLKEFQDELRARKEEELAEAKRKRQEKRRRKAENELKNARVQVISKTEKIKKMSKKQLRMVRKTKVDDEGNVQFVPIYSK